MKTLFSTLFNVMLRSVTIDKIEEFHCYSFDEGEIYVATFAYFKDISPTRRFFFVDVRFQWVEFRHSLLYDRRSL